MATAVIINPDIPKVIKDNLKKFGFNLLQLPLCENIERPIAGHVDIQMIKIDDNLFVHNDISKSFLKKIEKHINPVVCDEKLKSKYPNHIYFNACISGSTCFHKTEFTAKKIRDYLSNKNFKLINVNQGYTGCSTLVNTNDSIITSNAEIHNIAQKNNISSLLIKPGYIDLPGYKYGFIGGCFGKLEKTIYLNGKFIEHPQYKQIIEFIKKNNLEINFLYGKNIFDSGSMVFL